MTRGGFTRSREVIVKKNEVHHDAGFDFTPEPWSKQAACQDADPDLFHTEVSGSTSLTQAKAAKQICFACPVRAECLDFAYRSKDTHAILGGTTPAERKYANKRRTAA